MPLFMFKKPNNQLEGEPKRNFISCPKCKKDSVDSDLVSGLNVCPHCGYHFRMRARTRLNYICDRGSFSEIDPNVQSANVLDFPEYDTKLEKAKQTSNEADAVICGTATVGGIRAAIFVMDPYFMMGSMGIVVGEKITRLFELATQESLPVIGFTVSGGARMQEGILSLMQMAKISGAVKRHSDADLLYLCVLTDPTTGGVTASFAMEADIILAEPDALVGFAGPRVIEQTIRKKLPEGFQRAGFLLEKGFADDIIERKEHKKYLTRVLRLHGA
jgi:acetyl-CoA carboxylase carboxyl transferase subunit beta